MRHDVKRGAPRVAATAFVHPRASVCGAVSLGDRVSIWADAVLRGDTEQVTIGAKLLHGARIRTGAGGIGEGGPGGASRVAGSRRVGVPARLVRPTTEAERASVGKTSERYQALAGAHRDGLVAISADA